MNQADNDTMSVFFDNMVELSAASLFVRMISADRSVCGALTEVS